MTNRLNYLIRWDQLTVKLWQIYLGRQYAKSNDFYWKTLKNKYSGKSGFVICNGPSLEMDDLTKIHEKEFISVASNKIYLAFDKTPWRPDYYTVVDEIVWAKIKDEIHKYVRLVHTPNHWAFIKDKEFLFDLKCWRALSSYQFSRDASCGFGGGYSVTFENIQLAYHMGLNPIYLIGCDHFYKNEKNISAGVTVEHQGESNHFDKNYRDKGEKVNPAPIDNMEKAYRTAKLFLEKNNVGIYNATRGGKLEIFDRIDIDSVL